MPSASRCPECRDAVHPFAATCPSCGADLDAHRRRLSAAPPRRVTLAVPQLSRDTSDLVAVTAIMLVLALFAPLLGGPWSLLGLLLAAFITWHSHQNGLIVRRNVAIFCAALALFNLLFPAVLQPHLP